MQNDATPEQIRERQKLVSDHWPFVQSLARRLKSRLPGARLDDLIADGLYGLTLAGQGFDASRGLPFAAYARKFIVFQMIRPFKKESRERERRGGDVTTDAYSPAGRERAPEDQAAINEEVAFVMDNLGARPGKQSHGALKMTTIASRLGISGRAATSRLRKARDLAAEIRGGASLN